MPLALRSAREIKKSPASSKALTYPGFALATNPPARSTVFSSIWAPSLSRSRSIFLPMTEPAAQHFSRACLRSPRPGAFA